MQTTTTDQRIQSDEVIVTVDQSQRRADKVLELLDEIDAIRQLIAEKREAQQREPALASTLPRGMRTSTSEA